MVRSVIVAQAVGEPVPAAKLDIARRNLQKPRGQSLVNADAGFQQGTQSFDRRVDLIRSQHVFDRVPKILFVHPVDGYDFHRMPSDSLGQRSLAWNG